MQVTVDASARFLGAHHDILVELTRLRLLADMTSTLPNDQRQRLAGGLRDLGRRGLIEHHADEEKVLFTEMLAAAAPGDEAELVESLTARLSREHRAMEALWLQLEPALKLIEKGKPANLPADLAAQLLERYQAHARFEETVVLPLAERLLSDNDKRALDLSLRLRHQVDNLVSYI